MARRKAIDAHPGRLPDIRTDGKSVTFEFDPIARVDGARLVIRCDENGNVLASITSGPPE